MKSVRKSVLLFAFVWTLGCSNKPTTNPSASPPARVENAPLGDEVQDDAAASAAKSEVVDSGVVVDRSRLCGRSLGDLPAEHLQDGKFLVHRAALIRSVERLITRAEKQGTWFTPPPAQTRKEEIGYAMLGIGENSSCGFRSEDYLVRVNGKLLSNLDERMAVYSSLSSVSTLEVEIQRAGKPLTLVYLVRD